MSIPTEANREKAREIIRGSQAAAYPNALEINIAQALADAAVPQDDPVKDGKNPDIPSVQSQATQEMDTAPKLLPDDNGEVYYPGIVDQKTLAACLETAEQIIRESRPDRVERFVRAKTKLISQVKAHPLSFDEWNARPASQDEPLEAELKEIEARANAATPGPYSLNYSSAANAAFFRGARTDVHRLIELLRSRVATTLPALTVETICDALETAKDGPQSDEGEQHRIRRHGVSTGLSYAKTIVRELFAATPPVVDRDAVLEEAIQALIERAVLWEHRWRDNVRPEYKEEAKARLEATQALREDVETAIRALKGSTVPAADVHQMTCAKWNYAPGQRDSVACTCIPAPSAKEEHKLDLCTCGHMKGNHVTEHFCEVPHCRCVDFAAKEEDKKPNE